MPLILSMICLGENVARGQRQWQWRPRAQQSRDDGNVNPAVCQTRASVIAGRVFFELGISVAQKADPDSVLPDEKGRNGWMVYYQWGPPSAMNPVALVQ